MLDLICTDSVITPVTAEVRQKGSCICPNQNYTCQADNVIRMQWTSESITGDPPYIEYSLLGIGEDASEVELVRNNFKIKFSRSVIVDGLANISSSLFILDLMLNGTNVTCEAVRAAGQRDEENISLCIIGS